MEEERYPKGMTENMRRENEEIYVKQGTSHLNDEDGILRRK